MDLIDREALLNENKPVRVRYNPEKVVEMIPLQNIVSAPPVKVEAEVETTCWIFDKTSSGRFICEKCGVSISGDMVNGRYAAHYGFFPYPYCPMCGRKVEQVFINKIIEEI